MSTTQLQQIDSSHLATVHGGESFGQVLKSLPGLDQTEAGTMKFIDDHQFFHQGWMDKQTRFSLPLHDGPAHNRNIPFIGPGEMLVGAGLMNPGLVSKGWQVTKGTLKAQ